MNLRIIILLAIFLVISVSFILIGIFFSSTEQKPAKDSFVENKSNIPSSHKPLDASEQWDRITRQVVEKTLLDRAKDELAARGYPSFAVTGCTCTEQKTEDRKHYSCKISALDGEHALSLLCERSKSSCTIDSEFGEKTYSFDELVSYVDK